MLSFLIWIVGLFIACHLALRSKEDVRALWDKLDWSKFGHHTRHNTARTVDPIYYSNLTFAVVAGEIGQINKDRLPAVGEDGWMHFCCNVSGMPKL